MDPRETDDQVDGPDDSATGYTLGVGRTMKDVLEAQAKLLEGEGLQPVWKQEPEPEDLE